MRLAETSAGGRGDTTMLSKPPFDTLQKPSSQWLWITFSCEVSVTPSANAE
jgi:hypothetical protein